jgi:hypothetical protein
MSALSIYLRDHHAAACAGVRLARRIAARSPSSSSQAEVAHEIEHDLRALEQLMRELGVEPSRVKDAIAIAAERLARLKQGPQLVGRSSPVELIDLETLVVGITGKRALWLSLRELEVVSPPERLERLIERATSQLATVEERRRHAARVSLREGVASPTDRVPRKDP